MRLHHIALSSRSRENANRFYKDILKLNEIKSSRMTNDLSRDIFGVDLECELILYGNDDLAIEVFVTERISPRGPSVAHICLQVEDREVFLETCQAAGLRVRLIPRGEWKICFVEDFDGNLFEIKQETPDGSALQR